MVRMLTLMIVSLALAGCSTGQSHTDGPPPTIDATDDAAFSDSTDAILHALPNFQRGAFSRALVSLAKPVKPGATGPVSQAELCKHLQGMTGAEVIEMARPKPKKKK